MACRSSHHHRLVEGVGVVVFCLLWLAVVGGARAYSVEVLSVDALPVLSFVDGSSTFQQAFNPAWFSSDSASGLLVRSQNCSATPGGACTYCSGSDSKASVLSRATLINSALCDLEQAPVFATISADTIVFQPEEGNKQEVYGTEDPRIAFDPSTGLFYMFYTCYGVDTVLLCLATTEDPATTQWKRWGPVFPSIQGSKSGALLIRDPPPHYLFWGAGEVRVTTSNDPTVWASSGDLFLQPRENMFDSQGVESGPPPLQLDDGNYFFIYNAWNNSWPNDPTSQYHTAWVVLSEDDPSVIVQRADEPFLFPTEAWEQGVAPYTCNAPRVVFVEGAVACGGDVFRIFFGGADAVVGTALIKVA